MNKTQLVAHIADNANLSKDEASAALDAALDGISHVSLLGMNEYLLW